MLRLKSCPKCKTGDMVLDRDAYGSYMRCLQCGFLRYLGLPDVFVNQRGGTHSRDNAS